MLVLGPRASRPRSQSSKYKHGTGRPREAATGDVLEKLLEDCESCL
jgi:hypothetical protein